MEKEFLTKEELVEKEWKIKEKKHELLKKKLGLYESFFGLGKANLEDTISREKLAKLIQECGITSSTNETEKYIENIKNKKIDLYYNGAFNGCGRYVNGDFIHIQECYGPNKDIKYRVSSMVNSGCPF